MVLGVVRRTMALWPSIVLGNAATLLRLELGPRTFERTLALEEPRYSRRERELMLRSLGRRNLGLPK